MSDQLAEGRPFNPYRKFHNAWVPTQLLAGVEISHGAKLLYGLLRKYAGKDGACFPLQSTLARNMDCSERTVREYVRELKQAGLIRAVPRGKGRSIRYHFLWKNLLIPVQMSLDDRQEAAAMTGRILPIEEVQGSGSLTTNSSGSGEGGCENQRRGVLDGTSGEQAGTSDAIPSADAQPSRERAKGPEAGETTSLEENAAERPQWQIQLKRSNVLDRRPKSTPSPELMKHLAPRGELWTIEKWLG